MNERTFILRQIKQVGDGTNQDCWCNINSGHMVAMPDPYVGKHWLGNVLADKREAVINDGLAR